jgi:hypothetical protein
VRAARALVLAALAGCADPAAFPDSGAPTATARTTDTATSTRTDSGVPGTATETDTRTDTATGTDTTTVTATATATDTGGDALSSWRSALYPPDWTPAFTGPQGAFLHDMSYAGYHASEAPLPDVGGPVFDAVAYGADPTGATDSTAAVQATIDAAASAGGGVARLGAGTFRIDGLLAIRTTGVVLRGEGPAATRLWFTRTDGMTDQAHLVVGGSPAEGPDVPLAADGVSRAHTLLVADATGLAPGDRVHVGWRITPAFVAEHGMTGVWTVFLDAWTPFFRRTVVSVDTSVTPHRVTLDVPLRYAARLRDDASLRRVTGYVRDVGVEHLSVATARTWDAAWANDRTHAIRLQGVEDAWIRDVASFTPPDDPDGRGDHLLSGGIKVVDSRRVTVVDVHLAEAQNRGPDGNGYLFEVSRGSEILVRDSSGRAGRHNFIQNWDFGTSGCVWLRTHSAGGRNLVADWDPVGLPAWSEYHHSLAMANLVDQSTADDGWQAVNRNGESSGAGHSATQSIFWNTAGTGGLRSLQFGLGYVIGTTGLAVATDPDAWDWNNAGVGTHPADWVEGLDAGGTLEPASLFEDQLRRRLSAR